MTQDLRIPRITDVKVVDHVRDYDCIVEVSVDYQTRGPRFRAYAEACVVNFMLREIPQLRLRLTREALEKVQRMVIAHRAVTEPIPND